MSFQGLHSNLHSKELDDDIQNCFILKHGLTAIPQMKIEFHLSSYILKHVESVLKSTPILHHVLTNYANCIPNDMISTYYKQLEFKSKYYLVKNPFGTVLLIPYVSVEAHQLSDRMRPWQIKAANM